MKLTAYTLTLKSIALLAMLTASIVASAQGNIVQATLGETDPTTEVNTEQLRQILNDGSAVVLDSRSRAQYAAGHIPGAINLSLPADATDADLINLVQRLQGGDKNSALVLYCNGPRCGASRSLSKRLVDGGFTNVRRYQLGIPIWRSLGGPTVMEHDAITRIYQVDNTAVFFDVRSREEFAKGSLPGAHNVPVDELAAGVLDNAPKPNHDFNTRIILFGRDGFQARVMAEAMGRSAYHNVNYFPGTFGSLMFAINNRKQE
jgi:rhodanese-related sulfurtransferase